MTKREAAGKPTGGQFTPDTSGAKNIPTPNYPDTGTWTENVHNHFSKELLPIGQCPRCDERFSKEELEAYALSIRYEAFKKQTLVAGTAPTTSQRTPTKTNPLKTTTPVWDTEAYKYTYNEATPADEEPQDYTAIITKYPYLTVHASGCKHLSGKNIDSVGHNTKTLSAFKLEIMNNVDQDHDYDWKIKLAPCAVRKETS